MKHFGDNFDLSYFDADENGKREYYKLFVNPSAIADGRFAMDEVVSGLCLSDYSNDFVKSVFSLVGDLWFLLPTSTGGKYHGGVLSLENSIGGNIVHTSRVVGMVPKILGRYKELCNSSGLTYLNYKEVLTVSCLLHDIGKAGVTGRSVYSESSHGEVGADIISKASFSLIDRVCPFDFFIEPITYAVSQHMYMWRGINYLEMAMVNGLDPSLLVCIMLCECDFFS